MVRRLGARHRTGRPTAVPFGVTFRYVAATQFDVRPLVAFVAGIGQSTALVLLLVRPWAAVALQFLAVAAVAVAIPADSASTWPLTVPGMVTLIVYGGLAAARTSRRAALAPGGGACSIRCHPYRAHPSILQLRGRSNRHTVWQTSALQLQDRRDA